VSVVKSFAYKTGNDRRHLQLLLDESQSSLGSWLREHHFNNNTLGHSLRVEQWANAPPQVQFMVVDGWQYAVLAKCVNGANSSIWVGLRVVTVIA
jgi:hypothetical protein